MTRERKILVGALAIMLVALAAVAVFRHASSDKPAGTVKQTGAPKSSPEPNLSEALQKAQTAAQAKDYAGAEKILIAFVASAHINDDKYHAEVALGNIYFTAADYNKAVTAFEKAQDFGKVQLDDAIGLGNAATRQFFAVISKKDYDLKTATNLRLVAEDAYNAALTMNPAPVAAAGINTSLRQLHATDSSIK